MSAAQRPWANGSEFRWAERPATGVVNGGGGPGSDIWPRPSHDGGATALTGQHVLCFHPAGEGRGRGRTLRRKAVQRFSRVGVG
jgi:hypothetical protein